MHESKSGDKNLGDWFRKSSGKDPKTGRKVPGWPQIGGKFAGAPCARQPGQTTKPKCGSSKMKRNLNDEEEQKAFELKQRKDKNPNRVGKAINVATEETKKDHEYSMARSELKTLKNAAKRLEKKMGKKGEGELKAWVQSKITKAADYVDTAADYVTNEAAGEKDACYKKVKKRYKVWPSAYASGALVKCRKVGASNWGNKSESYNFSNWRDDFKANEYEFIDIIKPEPLINEGVMPASIDPDRHRKQQRAAKIRKLAQQGATEGERSAAENKTKGPKLFKFNEEESDEKCWVGYKQVGMKKKGKKVVPNCVPVGEEKNTSDLESNIGGGNLKKLTKKAVKRIDYDVDGDVDSNDEVEKKTGDYGEELPTPFGKFRTKVKKEEFSDWRSQLGEDWQKVNKSDKTDGMSPAAVKAYRRENPGSKLKTAVTGDPKPGSKDAKRRSSYCSRSEGQKDMHNIDCSKTPDKAICKARRRWKC